ncbi:transcription factor bHLH128-like isoform X2 [Phragmites australis]|uniref:transcription factor bHLH128-like isoform X2 n=1 Tax=Phragmites australis TaxID=29695 RepID=UPI002D7A2FD2|nr:transcription factor bHLH128-like isoform X2 [Phragmites australis]
MNRLTPPYGTMPPPGQGLARYGSAPGSLLAAIAASVTRGEPPPPPVSRFFSGESSGLTSCESSCRTDGGRPTLERAYGGSGEIRVPPPPQQQQHPASQVGQHGGPGVSPLFRHSSSPAGLLSGLMADPHGMAATRGMGSYSQAGTGAALAHDRRQLSSQWSFSRRDLPQISEMGMIPDIGESIVAGGCNSSSDGGAQSSYLSRNFSVSSWDDTNSIMFSSPSKKPKVDAADDIVTSLSNIDSQFGLSKSSLEMSGMDDYLQMQQDSIACRARAKRGCATHPRSIAERERRTRISKRLKKLQDLVPNMDKQTNTSDMLDLAVEYIKELKDQVEKLKHNQANCCCSGNQNS